MDAPRTPDAPDATDAAGRGRGAITRLLLLGAIVVVCIALARVTGFDRWLLEGRASALFAPLGAWGMPAYVVGWAVLLALWVPGTLLLAVGTPLWTTGEAMVLNYLGSLLGGVLGFAIARALGAGAMASLISRRVPGAPRYLAWIGQRGLEASIYIRLIPLPFNLMSYLAGLSPVRAGTYAFGTALGLLPGSFALTYLAGTLLGRVRDGDWMALLDVRLALALAVYAAVAMSPRWIRARMDARSAHSPTRTDS